MPIVINGTGTVSGLSVGGINDGAIAHADLATSTQPIFVSYALLEDRKAQNTAGGANTAGTSEVRDLNTEVYDPDGIIIGFNNKATSGDLKSNGTNYTTQPSANRFDLAAGTYLIKWSAPMYNCGRNKASMYDITNSAYIGYGTAEFAGDGYHATTRSHGQARVTITGNTTYELYSRGQSSQSSGMGIESNFGGLLEVYTQVEVFKEAS